MARKILSNLHKFVSDLAGDPVWIGVDVHKRKYHAALISRDGLTTTWSCPADPLGFTRQLKELGPNIAMVCYEAGPTGFVLARRLKADGVSVKVAAPSRIPRPVAPGAKSDRLDCLKLAELCMRGVLHGIAIPTETQEAYRSLCRRRHQIADEIRRVKQRIRSLLLEFGIEEPDGLSCWSNRSIACLQRLDLPCPCDLTMQSLLRELAFQSQEMSVVIKALQDALKQTRAEAMVERLRGVPGVGPVTARTFCLEVFSPERFRSSGELTSYLGLSPTTRHSGQGKARAKLRPVGQKRLRSLLIEAAWIWKSRDEYASKHYRRLVSRHGIAQKAITAVARKLAIILWRLCLENRDYRPGGSSA